MGFSDSLAGKDPSLIPGSGRSAGEQIGYPLQYSWTPPGSPADKESACNAGDLGSTPGLGRRKRLLTPVLWL